MKRYTLIIFLAMAIFQFGCADSYNLIRQRPFENQLPKNSSAYVVTPSDGRYGEKDYVGSGHTTAQIIRASLLKRLQIVSVSEKPEEYLEAIERAKQKRLSFVFYPTILHWEDRATEWSAIPDKVSIKISVIDVNTETELDSSVIEGRSGLATFGGDHPQDLLPAPIEEYISSLFK